MRTDLAPELRRIVNEVVTILGQTIQEKLGLKAYHQIEKIRSRMAGLRRASPGVIEKELLKVYCELSVLSSAQHLEIARAFTLMLELMNTCENAYRTYRLRLHAKLPLKKPKGIRSIKNCGQIDYVLTAHPTEARSPDNIAVFHEIQKELIVALQNGPERSDESLRSLIEIAWKVSIVRERKPRVQDEAEHIYTILLRDTNLSLLLELSRQTIPVSIRSWVGGDKDGHPGVDERTTRDSLQLSRSLFVQYIRKQLKELGEMLHPARDVVIAKSIRDYERKTSSGAKLTSGDASRIRNLHQNLDSLVKEYQEHFGKALPAPLARLVQLNQIFPGWVVPLEFREDSSVLMSDPSGKTLAIGRMLKWISHLGGNPRWYIKGMIISMCQSPEHIRTTVNMVRLNTGATLIPVVPLFEQKAALVQGPKIIDAVLKDKKFHKMVLRDWEGVIEVMVGYSDSSKESGVLPSRLAVNEALSAIDRVCATRKVKVVFFHGSGGSIDRGGGLVTDQMAGWPASAIQSYKATIQGEMVERTFASPEILESQLLKIMQIETSALPKKPPKHAAVLEHFTEAVQTHYRAMIHSPRFLSLVEAVTPYPYLSALKIGSRPTRRTGPLAVKNLRAIPWILCWTQTRVLFPTWWGIGSAWKELSPSQQKDLKKVFQTHSLFRSYVHALGFTLAKIELPIFELYLSQSQLDEKEKLAFKKMFRDELAATQLFFKKITGQTDYLWYRPWLGKSIELRASMIHPLNLLEILAQKNHDLPLLRISVTGIASGMLTTG